MQLLASFLIDRIDDDVVVQVICIGVSDDGELVALFAEKLLANSMPILLTSRGERCCVSSGLNDRI